MTASPAPPPGSSVMVMPPPALATIEPKPPANVSRMTLSALVVPATVTFVTLVVVSGVPAELTHE